MECGANHHIQGTHLSFDNMIWILAFISISAGVALGQFDPNIWDGRTTYVHLFEWKWTDIAAECERFLAPNGFAAVQISPPNEHRIVNDSVNPPFPWWQRYQPVSDDKLISRSGNETEFIEMVHRCNDVGVRLQHMAREEGIGAAGSHFDAKTQSYPGVPFGPEDFTPAADCPSNFYDDSTLGNICKYDNPQDVRNCRLGHMPDIAVYKDYPRSVIVNYLNKLVDIGVAGFRIDAAKHMWPSHLKDILSRLNNLNRQWFTPETRPFIFHEVIDLYGTEAVSEHEYVDSGRVTEFKYGMELSRAILKKTGLKLSHLQFFGTLWPGFVNGMSAVTFVDNHGNQRGNGGGGEVLTFRQSREYKIANAFMLAHPYGYPQVMSSYDWPQNWVQTNGNWNDENNWIGPPSNSSGVTSSITIDETDGTCNGGWRCEHRWRQITNMVGFRNVARFGDLIHWWTNNENQIAFGRGVAGATTAFIVINNDNWALSQYLQTGLPPGVYCEVISGNLENGSCTGRTVAVNGDRGAQFYVPNDSDPVVAIHINAKLT